MPIIPPNFNGEKFTNKYGLDDHAFYEYNGQLICITLPNLTDADLLDCTNDGDLYLSDDTKNRKLLIKQYQSTLNTLGNIESAVNPTNAQLIAAVKFLANTLGLLLKLLARMI